MKRLVLAAFGLAFLVSADAWRHRPPPPPPTPTAPTAAATTTANGAKCTSIRPFYWEIGDATGKTVGGSVGGSTYTQTTVVQIASASKIFYAAYVAQKRAGAFTALDVNFLTFLSGYSTLAMCSARETVGQCAAHQQLAAADVGKFAYGGGHMQKHAADVMGLGAMKSAALAAEVNATLGTRLAFSQPQPPGGISISAAETATFLRAVMSDKLTLGAHLSSFAVETKGAAAVSSPVPEAWHYGIGHWIEDAPGRDGAYSSPGAFGFYPWISADKKVYGVVSRKATGGAWSSVKCGREIRAAYLTGIAR